MRMRNPLPDLTDGDVLRQAARTLRERASSTVLDPMERWNLRALSVRLNELARRVPLWTRR